MFTKRIATNHLQDPHLTAYNDLRAAQMNLNGIILANILNIIMLLNFGILALLHRDTMPFNSHI